MASLIEDVWDLFGNLSSGLPVMPNEAGQCQCVGPVPGSTWSLQVRIGSSIWPLFLKICDSFSLFSSARLLLSLKRFMPIAYSNLDLILIRFLLHWDPTSPLYSCCPKSNICLQGYNPMVQCLWHVPLSPSLENLWGGRDFRRVLRVEGEQRQHALGPSSPCSPAAESLSAAQHAEQKSLAMHKFSHFSTHKKHTRLNASVLKD